MPAMWWKALVVLAIAAAAAPVPSVIEAIYSIGSFRSPTAVTGFEPGTVCAVRYCWPVRQSFSWRMHRHVSLKRHPGSAGAPPLRAAARGCRRWRPSAFPAVGLQLPACR
jgi:hypothetical protein